MTTRFEENLEKYAELVIKVGLNIQPGQRLLIGASVMLGGVPLESLPLVRKLVKHAYLAGARLVEVVWSDESLTLARFKYAPKDSFREYPTWHAKNILDYVENGDAVLTIYAQSPDLLDGQDPDLISMVQETAVKMNQPIAKMVSRNEAAWCIISAPAPGWSAAVFPGLSPAEQAQRMWETIFKICRIDQDDPVAAWKTHTQQLVERCNYLNSKQYKTLKYRAPGTDLTVGLPDGHIWLGGHMVNKAGNAVTVNLPTEEVFTLPHKDRVDGIVTASKPLSTGGSLIEDFSLTFEKGRVVNATAGKGQAALDRMLDADEGARQLGEVALVPHSSPISQSGLLFYNILYDENASNHLALGRAYGMSMKGGTTMSPEDFMAQGGNQSLIHVDFMIGSGEMDVDGITEGGTAVPVMRSGEWAFDI